MVSGRGPQDSAVLKMKRYLSVLACCLAWHAAPAADLLAVYQRALQNDPQLREAEANRLAALESKPQALAAMLPQLAANGTVSKEHDKGTSNLVESVQVFTLCKERGVR